MGLKDLENFINAKKEHKEEEEPIDWEAQKLEWLKELDNLYSMISIWLQPLKAKDKVKFKFESIKLTEDDIGTYDAPKMVIELPDQKIALEPIGTMLIGAKGRVNMIGEKGNIPFLLVRKNYDWPKIRVIIHGEREFPTPPLEEDDKKEPIEWVWKIATPPPRVKFLELDGDLFSDALLSVAR